MDAWLAALTFLSVIFLIMGNLISPPAAALAGTLVLVYGGVFTLPQAAAEMAASYSTLALLLGAMVVARALQPTGIFARTAHLMVTLSRGRGSRLLVGITLVTALISALLPNATAVLVLGPVLVPLARELKLDAEPLLVLVALAANSSGLLTMVGDPATYLVSQAAGLGFTAYLPALSWSGVVATAVLLALLPWVWRDLWIARWPLSRLTRPTEPLLPKRYFLPIVVVGCIMLLFFVAGELSHIPFSPDLIALSAATATLALAERFGLGSVSQVLRDIDWSTLIFFACTFILTGALESTGAIAAVAGLLGTSAAAHPEAATLLLLFGTAALSTVIPNIPLIVALIPLVQGMGAGQEVLHLHTAVLLGGSLGGNATMVGASANMTAVGLARQHGLAMLAATFLRRGLPVCLAQVATVGLLRLIVDIVRW